MKKLGVILLISVCIIGGWLLLPKQVPLNQQATQPDVWIAQAAGAGGIPGLAIAEIKQGKATLHQYGYADISQQRLVTDDTLFNIASISKPIMGVVLLTLIDQGKLDLDTDINDYLPFVIDNPKLSGEVITLRHLVSHSSSIADFYEPSSFSENQDSPISLEQHLRAKLTVDGADYNDGQYFLDTPVGSQRSYSNLAAALAGYLVEAVTGMSLAEYSKGALFEPLGMYNTRWLLADLSIQSIATPYEVETCIPYLQLCATAREPIKNFIVDRMFSPPTEYKTFHPYPHFGNPQYPDGGLRTSVKELSQFLTLIMNNRDLKGQAILSDAMYEEMWRLQLPETVSHRQRFFWRDNQQGLVGHMGSDPGVFTSLYFDRETRSGYIILLNRSWGPDADRSMQYIADRLSTKTSIN